MLREVKENKSTKLENSPLGKAISNFEKTGKPEKDSFFERLAKAEEREAREKAETIYKNKIDGCKREESVERDLLKKYPVEKGFSIIREAYLRNKNGDIVKDKETGQARRIDFIVAQGSKILKSIEVTSETADKTKQLAKEKRIRDAGGRFIKDSNGNLIEHVVNTIIERRK